MTLRWLFEVDWDNNGTFEADEANRMMGLTTVRGREHFVRPGGAGFERIKIGEALCIVQNDDGRYDALNTGSPLSPNIKPGREARLRVTDDEVTFYDVLRGRIEDVIPVGEGSNARALITIKDGWQWLRDRTVSKILQQNILTDVAIGHILDEADWPTAWGRDLGAGSDTLRFWWVDKTPAQEGILDVVESEFGRAHVAGNGQFVFRGRQAGYTETPAFTLTQAQVLREIPLPRPWEAVRNIIRVRAHPRIEQATGELWQLQQKPNLSPTVSLTLFAEFTFEERRVPALNVITPVATTDYTMNSLEDGSGTDLTADFTVTMTVLGDTAKLVVTNNGAQDGFITLLKIRGDAVDAPDLSAVEIEDATSKTTFGPRELDVDLPWQQSVLVATDFATWLRSWLKDELNFPVVRIHDRPAIQFAHELFTRLTFDSAKKGINTDFRIVQIKHQWGHETGEGVLTTWKLEAVDMQEYWTFPARMGEETIFAY